MACQGDASPIAATMIGAMVRVIASIRAREGALEEYVALFKGNVPNVLAEDGCLEYCPCVDADAGWPNQSLDPRRMTVVEKWVSMDALQAHSRAPHMAAFRKRAAHLVEEVKLQVVADV